MPVVHLIRHAQSLHNHLAPLVEGDPMLRDAPLTGLGHAQARALGAELAAHPEIELVVTSPLTRAIQTMLHAFGDSRPRLVLDLHREQLDSYCDVGRSPAALAAAFPSLDFDHLDDPWWYHVPEAEGPYAREPDPIFLGRVEAFARWLSARPEAHLAVVGHSTFLRTLTGHRFANAERLVLRF